MPQPQRSSPSLPYELCVRSLYIRMKSCMSRNVLGGAAYSGVRDLLQRRLQVLVFFCFNVFLPFQFFLSFALFFLGGLGVFAFAL